jgi:hypothetical protein
MAFTKKQAEDLGWSFVHEQPEVVEDLGDGISRLTPASFRAEKLLSGHTLNEEAESFEKLLERISLYEAGLTPLEWSEEPSTESDLNPGAEPVVEEGPKVEAEPVEA